MLTTLLGSLGGNAQREQKKSHAGSCDDTTDIRRSEKLQFRETSKKCSINSTLQVELSWRKIMWEVRWGVGILVWPKSKKKEYKGFNQNFSRVKCRYGLLIRLKANKF